MKSETLTYLALLAFFALVLALGLFLQNLLIKLAHRFRVYQAIRTDGPPTHQAKAGTPTLGGLGIMVTLVLASLAIRRFNDFYSYFLLYISLSFGLLGLLDDLLLFFKIGKRGLSGQHKFSLQILLALAFCYILVLRGHYASLTGLGAWLGFNHPLPYFLLSVVLIVSTVNSLNLTDGLDGLAAGVSLPILLAFLFISMDMGSITIPKFIFFLILAVMSFFIKNLHPASIFMGDSGSHLLGAAIAGLALVLHKEFLLIILAGIPVAEALSVILQVGSYKLFKKRIFKMSPLHHHFELAGWPESKVVYIFWLVSGLLSAIGLFISQGR